MGCTGIALVGIPLMSMRGLSLFAAVPLIALGAALLVLAAFHSRIDGLLRFREVQIPIAGDRAGEAPRDLRPRRDRRCRLRTRRSDQDRLDR